MSKFLKATIATALLAVPMTASHAADKAVTIANYAKPNKNHKIFEPMVGKWRGKGIAVVSSGSAPEKVLCRAEYKMILGGRFLEQKQTCKSAGVTVEGTAQFGYDNLFQKYVGATFSNVESGIGILEGVRKNNKINFVIRHNDVINRKKVSNRAELVIEKGGKHTYRVIGKDKAGKDEILIEIAYAK